MVKNFKHSSIKQTTAEIHGTRGNVIVESESVRDLGIYMSNDAAFHVHIAQMATVCSMSPSGPGTETKYFCFADPLSLTVWDTVLNCDSHDV